MNNVLIFNSEEEVDINSISPNSIVYYKDSKKIYIKTLDNSKLLGTINLDNSIITLSEFSNSNSNYYCRYEDSSGVPIKNFRKFLFSDFHLISENIFPRYAKSIGIYDFYSLQKVGKITLPDISYSDRKNYSFGLLADIHYNDHDFNGILEDDSAEFNADFINAVGIFKKYGTDFITIAGDLTDNYLEDSRNFKDIHTQEAPEIPVYACKGNHDNKAVYRYIDEGHTKEEADEIWNSYILPEDKSGITYCETDKSSYYFQKGSDVYIFLSVDYGILDAHASTETYQYYSQETLDWFSRVLDNFRNQRCFVFTHLFFTSKTGNYKDYYRQNHASNYILSYNQYDILDDLNNYYKNSIWFTGHSHYKWDLQKGDSKVNIYRDNSAWNVHIPSLAKPLLGTPTYRNSGLESEGGIVDVYDNYIDIKGIEFKTRWGMISDDFTASNDNYLNSSNVRVDTEGKSGYLISQRFGYENGYLKCIFTNQIQRFIIDIDQFKFSKIFIKEIKIIKDGIDITNELRSLDSPKIGFYSEAYDFEDDYEIESTWCNLVSGIYPEITISGSFTETSGYEVSESSPIEVWVKAKLFSSNIDHYNNLYTPLAQYRLNIGGINLQTIESRY